VNYEVPTLLDPSFQQGFDQLTRSGVSYRSKSRGFRTDAFDQAEEVGRQEAIYNWAKSWSTEVIESQLEALSSEKAIEKELMAGEWFEMIRVAKEAGRYDEFEKWNTWRRNMRSLHQALSKVYKERVTEKADRLSPKPTSRSKGIFGFLKR